MTTGLEIDGLTVVRAGSPVVRNVSLDAPAGAVTVLVGPNGAGKTSLLEAVSGIVRAAGGHIRLAGATITALSRLKRTDAGLTHVEQGRTVFGELTAEENLGVVGDPAPAWELFPELEERRAARASALSGGEQQMLVIARALLREPRVLLIDEVSLGLAPVIVQRIVPVLRDAADRGVAVVLVEQFVSIALDIGDHAHVMAHGDIVLSAACDILRRDPEALKQAYFSG